MPNALLQKYLKKRISQPTVILCFRILLENAIKNGLDVGMRKSEIAKIFNIKNKQFGIQNFKTDYILRQTGIGHEGAIIEKEDVFFIDEDFITDLVHS